MTTASHPRFRLRTLLLWMAFVALATAALVRPSYRWAILISTSVVLSVRSSTALGFACKGARRAFWLGFAVTGWVLIISSKTDVVRLGPGMERSPVNSLVRVTAEQFHPSSANPLDVTSKNHYYFWTSASFLGKASLAILSGYFSRWVWERGRKE